MTSALDLARGWLRHMPGRRVSLRRSALGDAQTATERQGHRSPHPRRGRSPGADGDPVTERGGERRPLIAALTFGEVKRFGSQSGPRPRRAGGRRRSGVGDPLELVELGQYLDDVEGVLELVTPRVRRRAHSSGGHWWGSGRASGAEVGPNTTTPRPGPGSNRSHQRIPERPSACSASAHCQHGS